ncbi:DNA-directed RNA polymerase subunit omega [Dolosicoccus paucivorans]|nr:DNA-directed RNA polymerase subunit omega [Dolosicoccus paucivorans]
MLYPSIDRLIDAVPSKYSMIILASKRAHQLDEYDNELLEKYQSVSSVGKALEEIAEGVLQISEDAE